MARITFLGTDDAFHSGGRRHSAYLLEENGVRVLVDCGATTLLALRTLQLDPATIDAVLLTHLHGDHILGLPFLVLDGIYCSPRSKTLQICGPLHMRQRFDLLMRAAYEDVMNDPRNFNITIEEWAPRTRARVSGLEVFTYPADHMNPPHAPLMLRIQLPSGKIVSFTGDTRFCNELFECEQSADVLVAECTGLCPPMGRHSTWEDWRENISKFTAGKIALSHMSRPVREASAELFHSIRRDGLSFAEDGAVLEF